MSHRRNPAKSPRRFWSAAELKLLAKLYPERPTKEVARTLRHGMSGVYGMAAKLGLKKSAAFNASDLCGRLRKGHAQRGQATRFKKGLIPANKGLRRPGYSVGRGRMQETQFKKGQRTGAAARNWKPVGTILIDDEGYQRIKVRDHVHGKEPSGFGNTKVWPMYNRYVWEQHHGPIPPSHVVVFKDGNRARTISAVAQTIINVAKVEVDMVKAVGGEAPADGFFQLPPRDRDVTKHARAIEQRTAAPKQIGEAKKAG